MEDLANKNCIPCEGGIPAFDIKEIHKYFGIGGAGRRALAHDHAHTMAVEIYKYDVYEGQFVERMEEWENIMMPKPRTLPKADT